MSTPTDHRLNVRTMFVPLLVATALLASACSVSWGSGSSADTSGGTLVLGNSNTGYIDNYGTIQVNNGASLAFTVAAINEASANITAISSTVTTRT